LLEAVQLSSFGRTEEHVIPSGRSPNSAAFDIFSIYSAR